MSTLPEIFGPPVKGPGSTVADTAPPSWDQIATGRWDEIAAFDQGSRTPPAIYSGAPAIYSVTPDGDNGSVSWNRLAGAIALAGLPAIEAADVCDHFDWEAGFSVSPLADILPAVRNLASRAEFSTPEPAGDVTDPLQTPADEWIARTMDVVIFQAEADIRSLPPDDHDGAGYLVRAVRAALVMLADEHKLAVFSALAEGVPVPDVVRADYPETLPCPEPGTSCHDRLVVAEDGRWFAALPDGAVRAGRVERVNGQVDSDSVITDLVRAIGLAASHPFTVPPGRPTAVAVDGQVRYVVGPAQGDGLMWQAYSWPHGGEPAPLPVPPSLSYDETVTSLASALPRSAVAIDPVAVKARPEPTADVSPREPAEFAGTPEAYWKSMQSAGSLLPKTRAVVNVKVGDGHREVKGVTCGPLVVHRSVTAGNKWSVTHAPTGLLVADEIPSRPASLGLVAVLATVAPDGTPTPAQSGRMSAVVRAFQEGQIPPPATSPVQKSLFADDIFALP
jgi:hypothetical protein